MAWRGVGWLLLLPSLVFGAFFLVLGVIRSGTKLLSTSTSTSTGLSISAAVTFANGPELVTAEVDVDHYDPSLSSRPTPHVDLEHMTHQLIVFVARRCFFNLHMRFSAAHPVVLPRRTRNRVKSLSFAALTSGRDRWMFAIDAANTQAAQNALASGCLGSGRASAVPIVPRRW